MATIDEIRQAAEDDLVTFIKLVAPEQVLGQCHVDLINWWEREDHKTHQLVLMPRDHRKSALVAFRVAWYLTKNPCLRVLYISATSNLAEKQLSFIKNIITRDIYRRYWPNHVHPDEGRRSKWTNSEIELDHPLRKKENIRDPSVFTAGLTTSITGLHCDIAVLDDTVVYENAYTPEGRERVKGQYSLLSSIEGGEALEWVVGTRYHPSDLYNELLKMREDVYDENGEKIDEEPIYEVWQRQVEDVGDGSGEFLWPRQQRADGKWFGFDRTILARKRGQYLDRGQFRAQYYNDPTDPDNAPIDSNKFQYYDKTFLTREGGFWYYRNRKLNVVASIDFAYSLSKQADFSAISVIGLDSENNYYILDLERFKTDRISEYFKRILAMSNRWSFRKLRAEVTAAQQVIVTQLREEFKKNGLAISIDEYRPDRRLGSKEERIASILEPRYDNMQMWHYRGGNCQMLEDELITRNPPHDDLKDSVASAVDVAVKPSDRAGRTRAHKIDWASMKFRGN